MSIPNSKEIIHQFTYQTPNTESIEKMRLIREKGKELALLIDEYVGVPSDRWAAVRHVREAVMTANAGIVLHR